MNAFGTYQLNWSGITKTTVTVQPYDYNGPQHPASSQPLTFSAASSLVLPGRHVGDYGEHVNQTLLRMLEHFASPIPPAHPTDGQLWWCTGSSSAIVEWDPVSKLIKTDNQLINVTSIDYSVCYINAGKLLSSSVLLTTIEDRLYRVDGTLPDVLNEAWVVSEQAPRMLRYHSNEWRSLTDVAVGEHSPDSKLNALWYNTNEENLYVCVNDTWVPVTQPALPVSGGTMLGAIDMGEHPILYTGPINNSIQLVNKGYVDALVNDITGGGSGSGLSTGGVVNGVLKIGTQTSILNVGIDGGGHPIINPSINWDPMDYTGTVLNQGNFVPNKQYVAAALSQHLIDHNHGDGFFDVQSDGSGVAKGVVRVHEANSRIVFSGDQSQFTLGASGTNLSYESAPNNDAVFHFRHGILAETEPSNLTLHVDVATVGTPLHIFDGQPQPLHDGDRVSINDDTKAATKGFVRHAISSIPPIEQYINANGVANGDVTFNESTGIVFNTSTIKIDPLTGHLALSGEAPIDLTTTGTSLSVTAQGAFVTNTLFLLDGQPQPNFGGDVDQLNDDTAAAAKGFVRSSINAIPVITSVTFDSSVMRVDLVSNDTVVATAGLSHTHPGGEVMHQLSPDLATNPNRRTTYEALVRAGVIAEVGGAIVYNGPVSLSSVVDILDSNKAPITDPQFINPKLAPNVANVVEGESDPSSGVLMFFGTVGANVDDEIKLNRYETSGTLNDPLDPLTTTKTSFSCVIASVEQVTYEAIETTYESTLVDPDNPASGTVLVPIETTILKPGTRITLTPGHDPIQFESNVSWTGEFIAVVGDDPNTIPNVRYVNRLIQSLNRPLTQLTLGAGWESHSVDETLSVSRSNRVVELVGTITATQPLIGGEVITTLPDWARPTRRVRFNFNTGPVLVTGVVGVDGAVQVDWVSNDWVDGDMYMHVVFFAS